MDITPPVPAGRQVIERYGEGRFRISGQDHQGSVIVFPDKSLRWDVADAAEIALDSLDHILRRRLEVEVLLIGTGARMVPTAPALRSEMRRAGISVEPMDTGAACRTFNVLLAEGRPIAAALIAVD